MMDEYIKREDVISAVCDGCNKEFSDEPCEPSECAIRQSIMALHTADVVPKSEYDRLEKLFNDMTQEAKGYLNRLYGIRSDVAREIFEEIDKAIGEQYPIYTVTSIIKCLAELKKKHTEGEK